MTNHNSKYKLIYILGAPHCGSTLLDMIIGSDRDTFSLGELFYFNAYKGDLYSDKLPFGRICTCGKHFNKCPFWKDLIEDNRNIIKDRTILESAKILLNVLNPFENRFSLKTRIGDNHSLLTDIFTKAKKENKRLIYLIDSSKDPRRLYELVRDKKIPNQDIYVIHLIRDARAYVNSYQKPIRINLRLKLRNTFTCISEWILINYVCIRIIKKYRLQNITITYDYFARQPKTYIKQISSFLHINISEDGFLEHVRKTTYHNVNGNIIRFREIPGIKYDEEWRKRFNWSKKVILTILSYPFNKFWVYTK